MKNKIRNNLLTMLTIIIFNYSAESQNAEYIPKIVKDLAPVLALHSDEKYMPADPKEFIRKSRFRKHKGWGKDHGWNKKKNKFKKSNSHSENYYDIPIWRINQYKQHKSGKNRRPRDKNHGSKNNVFLETKSPMRGIRNPNGRIPTFVHWQEKGGILLAQYWFFYGYNDGFGPINHQGDWEAIAVHYNKITQKIIGAQFSAHGKKKFIPRKDLRFNSSGKLMGYSSKGTHAIYPTPGVRTIYKAHKDKSLATGYQWNTGLNLKALKNQPWKDFAGAWGAIGEISDTTGPLGPWHKLIKMRRSPNKIFEIRTVYGKCLDVAGGKNKNGTNIQIYQCNGSKSQKWIVTPNKEIRNVMGRCLDVYVRKNIIAKMAQLNTCNSSKAQVKRNNNVSCLGAVRAKTFVATNIASTRIKAIKDQTKNVQLYTCNNNKTQKWSWLSQNKILNKVGQCLEVNLGRNLTGTNVQVNNCKTTKAQKWYKK